MKTTVIRGTALSRRHMRKLSTWSSNISPPCAREGLEYILLCGQSRYKCPPFVGSCSYASFFLRLPVRARISSQDVLASWRPRGGRGGSLGSVPLVNVDREKLLLFVYTGGMRDARLTRRARLVYAGSRITTLIKRSGGVDAAAGSFGGAVIPQSIYDLRPLTPATRRRNESC